MTTLFIIASFAILALVAIIIGEEDRIRDLKQELDAYKIIASVTEKKCEELRQKLEEGCKPKQAEYDCNDRGTV